MSFVWVHATGDDSAVQQHANKRKVRQQVRKHVGDQWKSSRRRSLEIRQVLVQPGRGGSHSGSVRKNPAAQTEQERTAVAVPASGAAEAAEAAEEEEHGEISTVKLPKVDILQGWKVDSHTAAVSAIIAQDGSRRDAVLLPAPTGLSASRPGAVNYEAARARYNFDLSWLSGLTISHVGSMRGQDERLHHWLRHQEATFLDLIPLHYGESRLLQRVVDSILAKANYTMAPSQKTHERSLWAYGLALKEVQIALGNPEAAKSTEMLCAIRILQIYELLEATTGDSEKAQAWERRASQSPEAEDEDPEDGWRVRATQSVGSHSQGMQSLVRMRHPTSFKTEMDKSLLCSLLEGFWLQAYLNNTDYFLETPEWRVLIKLFHSEKDVARHPLALDLWITLSPLPRLLRQSDAIIQSRDLSDARDTAQNELQRLRHDLKEWITLLETSKERLPFTEPLYQELLGFGLGTLAIVCRVLVALDAASPSALPLEAEAQALSKRTFTLLLEHIVSSGFFVGMVAWATAKEWQDAIRSARQRGDDLLDREVFAKWNGMMGRKPHSERLGVPWRGEVDAAVRMFWEDRARGLGREGTYIGLVWYL